MAPFLFFEEPAEDSDGKQIAVVLDLDGAVIAADQTRTICSPRPCFFPGTWLSEKAGILAALFSI